MSCTTTCIQPSPSQAHCSVCHITWGGVSGFDRHRRDGQCLTPAQIGYADNGSGVYRLPMSDRGRERLAALAASRSRTTPQTASTASGVLGIANESHGAPEGEWGDYPLQETYPGSGTYE